MTVNGTLPGSLLRLKEGQGLTVDLVNTLFDRLCPGDDCRQTASIGLGRKITLARAAAASLC